MKPFNCFSRKNILALSIITFAIVLPCKSQKITVGSMAGINYTFLWNRNINGTLDNESTMNMNFSGGASYGIDGHLSISKYFDVSLGLMRANQNASYNTSYDPLFGSSSGELNTKMDYLDIPLLMRFKYKKFYMEAGPQVGFLLNAEEEFYNSGHRDVTNSFQSVNWMFDFGTGFSWRIQGRFSMTGGMRMGLGLSDVTREYSEEEGMPYDASIITQLAHVTAEDYYWLDIVLGNTNGGGSYPVYYSYEKTKRYFIGLNLSLRYDLFANKNK